MTKIANWLATPLPPPTRGRRLLSVVIDAAANTLQNARIKDLEKRIKELERKAPV